MLAIGWYLDCLTTIHIGLWSAPDCSAMDKELLFQNLQILTLSTSNYRNILWKCE